MRILRSFRSRGIRDLFEDWVMVSNLTGGIGDGGYREWTRDIKSGRGISKVNEEYDIM